MKSPLPMTLEGALIPYAARYIWWEAPEQAVRRPLRVIAQVMDLGDFEDANQLLAEVGRLAFREALGQAGPGWFNARSWHYWHYRLGLAEPGARVPPMPRRRIP
jgi:hypothetical protein